MPEHEARARRGEAVGRALLIVVAAVLVPALAHAHFILVAPDSWMSQDVVGGPQKRGPCGDEGGGTPTGKVTAFRPGETITVTIDEVIAHPGHYRVGLAVTDRGELPPEPEVTPRNGDPCASAAIQDPPQFPILADNVLPHEEPFAAPQTFTVTLPANVTCSKCTLQVLEFMSRHPPSCFYHHCADISILGDPVASTSTTLPRGRRGGGSTTTTTAPCPSPRCTVEAVLRGSACGSETIPAAIRRRLERAPTLLDRAETAYPVHARALRRRARRFLKRAGGSALRAGRGERAKLSAGCAASIKEMADRLARGL